MFTSKVKPWLFQVVCALVLACSSLGFASEAPADTAKVEQKQESSFKISSLWTWPFENIIQPVLNGLVYPLAKPIDYIFSNGVVDRTVELITFGEKKNILIYPSFNFKPGSSTAVGVNYRHRNLVFDKDYTVLQFNYYGNGDLDFTARYSKHALFGTPLFGAFRYDLSFNRDRNFTLPESKTYFTQPDSTFKITWRMGIPLNDEATWNLSFQGTLRYNDASLPDLKDSILNDDIYPIADHGLYQKGFQFPLELSLFYDNLDNAYAPSKGSRFGLKGIYSIVPDYFGLDESIDVEPSTKNHDYIRTELLFQHYFFLGSSKQYILSAKEARQNRKFYTDFSWDEAMRIWKPGNVMNTLFERRVIALQMLLIDTWEMEEGGGPFNMMPTLNSRTPLRGYADSWDAHHLFSVSCEYRWPVDRFVDGVLFDEYAMIAPKINKWSRDRIYNSWGFGIRVRMPNLYLFRVQLGFHGLHGVNMIMTIVPEYR